MLRRVDFLADVDEPTLERLAARSTPMRFANGEILVAELESGADVYVVLEGEAEVSVDARDGSRKVLGKLGPGGAFGEMSSLTGELRSATVTARSPLEVLRIADADFDALREQRPACAARLVRVLAGRLADTERTLDALLTEERHRPAEDVSSAAKPRGSVGRVWRELVVSRQRDLAFFTLTAFVLTVLLVRGFVFLSFEFALAPRDVLRGAYMTGFALAFASSCASLLTFRLRWRYAIAVAYGIGAALIFNSLGVTLAFDIFYKDIHTPDPDVAFDLERLYRRTEPVRAIVIGFVVLLQAVYLRRFYRRAAFVLMTRLRAVRRLRVRRLRHEQRPTDGQNHSSRCVRQHQRERDVERDQHQRDGRNRDAEAERRKVQRLFRDAQDVEQIDVEQEQEEQLREEAEGVGHHQEHEQEAHVDGEDDRAARHAPLRQLGQRPPVHHPVERERRQQRAAEHVLVREAHDAGEKLARGAEQQAKPRGRAQRLGGQRLFHAERDGQEGGAGDRQSEEAERRRVAEGGRGGSGGSGGSGHSRVTLSQLLGPVRAGDIGVGSMPIGRGRLFVVSIAALVLPAQSIAGEKAIAGVEVKSLVVRGDRDLATPLRASVEREVAALDLKKAPKGRRFVLGISLTKLETSTSRTSTKASSRVSLIIRDAKTGALQASVDGSALAEDAPTAGARAEDDAIAGAVKGVMRSVPGVLTKLLVRGSSPNERTAKTPITEELRNCRPLRPGGIGVLAVFICSAPSVTLSSPTTALRSCRRSRTSLLRARSPSPSRRHKACCRRGSSARRR